jgi:hypothetical protein
MLYVACCLLFVAFVVVACASLLPVTCCLLLIVLKSEYCQLVSLAPQISSIDCSMMINVFKCFQLFLFSHSG